MAAELAFDQKSAGNPTSEYFPCSALHRCCCCTSGSAHIPIIPCPATPCTADRRARMVAALRVPKKQKAAVKAAVELALKAFKDQLNLPEWEEGACFVGRVRAGCAQPWSTHAHTHTHTHTQVQMQMRPKPCRPLRLRLTRAATLPLTATARVSAVAALRLLPCVLLLSKCVCSLPLADGPTSHPIPRPTLACRGAAGHREGSRGSRRSKEGEEGGRGQNDAGRPREANKASQAFLVVRWWCAGRAQTM